MHDFAAILELAFFVMALLAVGVVALIVFVARKIYKRSRRKDSTESVDPANLSAAQLGIDEYYPVMMDNSSDRP